MSRPRETDSKWNSSAEVKASIEDGKAWIVTFRIPMKDPSAFVGQNQIWTMNVYRTRPARGQDPLLEYSWAVMGSSSFNAPAEFGTIKGINVPKREDGVTRINEAGTARAHAGKVRFYRPRHLRIEKRGAICPGTAHSPAHSRFPRTGWDSSSRSIYPACSAR